MDSQETVDIECTKSPEYRSVLVDGTMGYADLSKQFVVLALYSEKAGLPNVMTHLVQDNVLGEPLGVDARLTREFEVGIIMTPDVAKKIMSMIGAKLNELQSNK